jgi:hypothetical protein
VKWQKAMYVQKLLWLVLIAKNAITLQEKIEETILIV